MTCCQQVMVLNALILPVVPQSPPWGLGVLVLPNYQGVEQGSCLWQQWPVSQVGHPAATSLCLGIQVAWDMEKEARNAAGMAGTAREG